MNRTLTSRWIVAGACLLLNGCTVCELALRTVRYEPAAYSWKHDKQRSRRLYRSWAEEAWQQEQQGCADHVLSKEFGMGFQDGFVDYVYAGGTGEPPPVPPRRFWNAALRSPAGQERAQEWFDGYRRGAQVARDDGYRSMATVHSSLMGMEPQSGGGPLEMYTPDESNFLQAHVPFEDDLPSPNSSSQPEAATPEEEKADTDTKQLESSKSAPALGEPSADKPAKPRPVIDAPSTSGKDNAKVPASETFKAEPQDLKLPAIDSQSTPEGVDLPGERRVAPPLEVPQPASKPTPKSDQPEAGKKESASPRRSSQRAVVDTGTSVSRLVLVQHVEPSPRTDIPNIAKSTDVRFIDWSGTTKIAVPSSPKHLPEPLTHRANPAVSAATAPPQQTGLRFVANEQANQEMALQGKSTANKNSAAVRIRQPADSSDSSATRVFEK